MKLNLGSDLHIEFGTLEVKNKDDADVLILSGDIVIASAFDGWTNVSTGIQTIVPESKTERFYKFFEACSKEFKDVIYIMGNHEHYHGDFSKSKAYLQEFFKLEGFNNIHLLDKATKTIGDVTFVGGTLWTDMNKEDPITLFDVRRLMNDFRICRNGEFKLTPDDVVEDHKLMLKFIDEATKDCTKKYVVVGHHAPTKQSVKPRYENEVIMNGAYSSDLVEFILNRPQIKIWTHGHTHDVFDYMVGSTRVVCNPRGYIGYEERADNFEFLMMEV